MNIPNKISFPLEYGPQPIAKIMEKEKISRRDLVQAGKFITFKMVAKAERGRRLSLKIQQRICDALNKCLGESRYKIEDLFTYRG